MTRRVDLDQAADLTNPLSSHLTQPDRYSAVEPAFATSSAADTPIGASVDAQIAAVAPFVDEYTADALSAWLDQHLPGWAAHTDQETLERLATQRRIIAQNLHAVVTATTQLAITRTAILKAEYMVTDSDAILLGHIDHYPHREFPTPVSVQQGVTPMPLPTQFAHPQFDSPSAKPAKPAATEPDDPGFADGSEPLTLIETSNDDNEGVA